MDDQEIRYLGDVQRLSLKPGDILVVTCAQPISEESASRIRQFFSGIAPEHKVVVLSAGMKIGVLGAGD